MVAVVELESNGRAIVALAFQFQGAIAKAAADVLP